jgi:uncharacterized protein
MTPPLGRLEARVRSYGATGALVALSGGVDSSVVLSVAARALGAHRVTAITAVSSSYPTGELDVAREIARSAGVPHRVIETHEVELPAYARNDALRCFHCKTELYTTMARLASLRRSPDVAILAGANADDRTDFRPGLRAAEQFGVRNPLLEESLGKEAVRALARELGLTVADKPALACLSSRVAFGIAITPELLVRIDQAEEAVRGLGFTQVRVRHFGKRATIEVPAPEVDRLTVDPRLPGLLSAVRSMGWDEVSVDPDGYRPGSMNATLVQLSRKG